MALEVLEAIEHECNQLRVNDKPIRINELFDLIVGVSTGALIGALIGACGLDIEHCREKYRCV